MSGEVSDMSTILHPGDTIHVACGPGEGQTPQQTADWWVEAYKGMGINVIAVTVTTAAICPVIISVVRSTR